MKLDLSGIKWVVRETIFTQLKPNHFHRTMPLPLQLEKVRFLGVHLPGLLHLPSALHLRCILIPRNILVGQPRAPTVVLRRSLADILARPRLRTQLRLLVALRIHRHLQGRLLRRPIIPLRNPLGIHLQPLLPLGVLPLLHLRIKQ